MAAIHVNRIFHALADRTRCELVQRLARSECTVGELAEPYDMSLPAITKHLNVLEDAGLVSKRRSGKFIICQLKLQQLNVASRWIEKQKAYWQNQLDSFDEYLSEQQKLSKKRKRKKNE